MASPLLSVDELAERWGFSRSTIYKWVAAEKIPTVRIGGSVRIPLEYVEGVETEWRSDDPKEFASEVKKLKEGGGR